MMHHWRAFSCQKKAAFPGCLSKSDSENNFLKTSCSTSTYSNVVLQKKYEAWKPSINHLQDWDVKKSKCWRSFEKMDVNLFPWKKTPHLQLSKCVDRTVPSHRIHRYMTWKPWHHPRCWRCCRKTAMSCWEANLMDLLRLPPRSLKVGFFLLKVGTCVYTESWIWYWISC